MILYYVRHGDPTYQPDALTPLGHRQAEAVCRRIAQHGIDRVYASSSVRAQETAQPLCEMLHKEAQILDWCHEKHAYADMHVFDKEGNKRWANDYMPIRRIFAQEKCRRLGSEWYEHPDLAPWREQFKAGMERVNGHVDAWMRELGFEHDREAGLYRVIRENSERIALFAHAGFGRMFLSSLLDISYSELSLRTDMGHSGMTVIEMTEREGVCMPRMLMYSADGHIYAENLPTKYNYREFI